MSKNQSRRVRQNINASLLARHKSKNTIRREVKITKIDKI